MMNVLPRSGAETIALVVFVALVMAVTSVVSTVTLPAIPTWYAGLTKPSFTPPNWVFGPVWTTLYLMMAYAAWRVWRTRDGSRGAALVLFVIQLALNFGWSLLFFGAKQIGLALVDMTILAVAIVATIAAFAKVEHFAAWLLAPYFAWVAFASVLNLAIWRLNA